MPVNLLAAGSQNVFIEDGAKLEPRAGMEYFGNEGTPGVESNPYWTLAHRIHSKYDEFVNKQGIKIPLRVFYEGHTAIGDKIDVWLPEYIAGVAQTTSKWYTITPTAPTFPIVSKHQWYFAEWFDPILAVLQPELIFTFGGTRIGNWSGGFAPIISFTGTTITTNDIWTVKGFIDSPEGTNIVVINGIEYIVTAGFGTNTITVASTAGVAINDIVFQNVYFNDTLSSKTTYDVCSAINNQVYYEDWNQRNVYISWNRNQGASTEMTNSAILADLNYSGIYNGSVAEKITVVIDSVIAQPERTFVPVTVGDVDNISFIGTHTGATRDTYQVIFTSVGPTFFYDLYLNNVLITANTPLFGVVVPIGNGISVTAFGTFPTPNSVGDIWTYQIGGTDTYTWYINGVLQANHVPVTTPIVNSGVTYTFGNPNGHSLGDRWDFFNTQAISRGWSNFTYDNPNRLPGQGFTILLDSNGWTMKPQEHTMLINSQAGHFYDVETKLSSSLLSETIVVTRLKSEPQNKVLFPYLLGYIKNQLATISNEKTFDLLGRQKFLELQQSKTISDAVRIDFSTVDWEDGNVIYFKRKIFFNVPRTTESGAGGCIFIYDDYKKYWHTPMVFNKRISSLSIIDNKLIGHSYEQNESYELFVGLNDLGTFAIDTRMVFPYESSGNRYVSKSLSTIGFEGYISGTPVINFTVNSGVGGCAGKRQGVIAPQNTKEGLCVPVDKASLGKSSLGFHGLGNDPVDVIPHFFYIKTFPNMLYYQRNITLKCFSLDQRWSIISLGTDLNPSNVNNVTITDPH